MNVDKVSIIMANYNYDQYIGEAIDSVLSQSYDNWELIIVDDGSTDDSLKIINMYVKKDKRIRLIIHSNHENRNLIETYKLGISQANSEFIAFLEPDDIWHKDSLNLRLEPLKKDKNIVLSFSDVKLIGNKQEIKKKNNYLKTIQAYYQTGSFVGIGQMLECNLIPTFSCAIVRKDALINIDYNKKYETWFDWWLWAQVAVKGRLIHIPQKLVKWRIHNKSKSYKFINKLDDPDRYISEFKKDLKIMLITKIKNENSAIGEIFESWILLRYQQKNKKHIDHKMIQKNEFILVREKEFNLIKSKSIFAPFYFLRSFQSGYLKRRIKKWISRSKTLNK